MQPSKSHWWMRRFFRSGESALGPRAAGLPGAGRAGVTAPEPTEPPGGSGDKGWGGTGRRRLTLSAGPGKALGRSRRRCPRCRCSCPWGTRSQGPFSLEGSGKGKLWGTKGEGVSTEQRRPPKHPAHVRGSAFPLLLQRSERCMSFQRIQSSWADGEPPKGGNNLGGTAFGCLLLPRAEQMQAPQPG